MSPCLLVPFAADRVLCADHPSAPPQIQRERAASHGSVASSNRSEALNRSQRGLSSSSPSSGWEIDSKTVATFGVGLASGVLLSILGRRARSWLGL